MTDNITPLFPAKPRVDNYFGGCPSCGKGESFLNIGRDHWFFCEEHQVKWWIGSNLFSGWREEDEAIWGANRVRLAPMKVVDPLPMTPPTPGYIIGDDNEPAARRSQEADAAVGRMVDEIFDGLFEVPGAKVRNFAKERAGREPLPPGANALFVAAVKASIAKLDTGDDARLDSTRIADEVITSQYPKAMAAAVSEGIGEAFRSGVRAAVTDFILSGLDG